MQPWGVDPSELKSCKGSPSKVNHQSKSKSKRGEGERGTVCRLKRQEALHSPKGNRFASPLPFARFAYPVCLALLAFKP